WWDELSRLVLGPTQVSGDLIVRCQGTTRRWLRQVADGGERWSADGGPSSAKPAGSRLDLHVQLHTMIRPLPDADRRSVLRGLQEWSKSVDEDPGEQRPMTADELRQFEEGGRHEVGLHTLTHPVLSDLPSAQQKVEIFEGKQVLEKILGHPVRAFAYP